MGRDTPKLRRKGIYMITVAAEKAGMHPQTLRIYETRGLIQPKRSEGNTRLYSEEDVKLLRKIQYLTTTMGMNLAGVEKFLEMEEEIYRLNEKIKHLESQNGHASSRNTCVTAYRVQVKRNR